MKYKYIYKTSEGVRTEGMIDAPSRDDVFSTLRKQGVRPIKVLAADGSLDNGAVNGVRRRVVLCLVLGALCLGGVVAIMVGRGSMTPPSGEDDKLFSDTNRRQILGDAVIIEKGIHDGWAEVFPHEGERFLASFAIPGVPAGLRNTTEEEIKAALGRACRPATADSIETRQIIAIVEGMKNELRAYLANGGTIKEYGQCLVARQEQEIGYYNRAKAEIDAAKKAKMPTAELEKLWETRNAELRNIGVKLVAWPED